MSIPAEAYRIRSTIISVEKGLHIFRYESAADEESPPFFIIAPIPADVEALEYMSDNLSGGNLCKPGDYLIIKAKRSIKIITTKGVYGALGKDHVELSFMPLNPTSRKPMQTALPAAQSLGVLPPPPATEQVKVAYVDADAGRRGLPRGGPKTATSGHSDVATEAQSRTSGPGLGATDAGAAPLRCSVRLAKDHEPRVYGIDDLPSEFNSAVKAVAFANIDRSKGALFSLRLTAHYSDGRQSTYEGRDVAATALGMTSITGIRLQAVSAEGAQTHDILSRLFGVAETTSEKAIDARQQTLVRRRVGVVMDL